MTREELIKKVALKMDEISSSDEVIIPVSPSDNNPLYTQINGLLNESINDVLLKAPIYRIQNQIVSITSSTTEAILDAWRRIAVFTVPDDFLRMVSITDSAFLRPIVDLAIEGDNIDKKQHNKFLVAKNSKPVAVIGRRGNQRTITCYSYNAGDAPNPTLLYIKRYNNDNEPSSNVEMNLDGYMIDIVSWVCAGKVFAAQGDINKGKICDENASALMV